MNQKRITNSKDLRKLRSILPDPVAPEFLKGGGRSRIDDFALAPAEPKAKRGLAGDLETALEAIENVSWTEQEAEALL